MSAARSTPSVSSRVYTFESVMPPAKKKAKISAPEKQPATWKLEASFSITGPELSAADDCARSVSSRSDTASSPGRNDGPTTPRSVSSSGSRPNVHNYDNGNNNVGFSFVNVAHPNDARGTMSKRTIRSHVARVQHSKTRVSTSVTTKTSTKIARRATHEPIVVEPIVVEPIVVEPIVAEPVVIEPKPQQHFVAEVKLDEDDDHDSGDNDPVQVTPPTLVNAEQDQTLSNAVSRKRRHDSAASLLKENAHYELVATTAKTLAFSKILRGGRGDPFWTYPVPYSPKLERIIDHYLINLAVDIKNIDTPTETGLAKTKWFPLTMSDPAVFYAMLLMGATHQAAVNPKEANAVSILQFKEQAISHINAAIKDPTRATGDATVAAISKMAAYEAIHGDETFFHAHMAGLQQIVRMRGGLGNLGMEGMLERVVIWLDSQASSYLGCTLKFDKKRFPSIVEHPERDIVNFGGKHRRGD